MIYRVGSRAKVNSIQNKRTVRMAERKKKIKQNIKNIKNKKKIVAKNTQHL